MGVQESAAERKRMRPLYTRILVGAEHLDPLPRRR
jgi:hypothetical protein